MFQSKFKMLDLFVSLPRLLPKPKLMWLEVEATKKLSLCFCYKIMKQLMQMFYYSVGFSSMHGWLYVPKPRLGPLSWNILKYSLEFDLLLSTPPITLFNLTGLVSIFSHLFLRHGLIADFTYVMKIVKPIKTDHKVCELWKGMQLAFCWLFWYRGSPGGDIVPSARWQEEEPWLLFPGVWRPQVCSSGSPSPNEREGQSLGESSHCGVGWSCCWARPRGHGQG